MKERIITALVLVLVIFGSILYASDYFFGVGVFLVALLSAYEWLKLAKVDESKVTTYLVGFSVISFVVSGFFVYLQFIFPVFWLYAAYKLKNYENDKFDTMEQNHVLALGAFALAPFCACLYILHSNNVAWIFIFILVVAAADSGAYFVGKAKGKTKMLPRLSPNKTIEGLLGGLFTAVIVATISLSFMDLGFANYILMVIVCVIAALVSVMGDVFESMMKRIAGVKDSGTILPGHGGVLDRLDGYMPALPIFVMLGYLVGVFTY
jgi:phosphatidate cytidylyltransferase